MPWPCPACLRDFPMHFSPPHSRASRKPPSMAPWIYGTAQTGTADVAMEHVMASPLTQQGSCTLMRELNQGSPQALKTTINSAGLLVKSSCLPAAGYMKQESPIASAWPSLPSAAALIASAYRNTPAPLAFKHQGLLLKTRKGL